MFFFLGGGRLDAAYTYIINVLTMEGAPQLLSKRYRGKGQSPLVSVQEMNTTKIARYRDTAGYQGYGEIQPGYR